MNVESWQYMHSIERQTQWGHLKHGGRWVTRSGWKRRTFLSLTGSSKWHPDIMAHPRSLESSLQWPISSNYPISGTFTPCFMPVCLPLILRWTHMDPTIRDHHLTSYQ